MTVIPNRGEVEAEKKRIFGHGGEDGGGDGGSCAGVPGCEVARLQCWEVARLQVYRQSKGIFLLVLLGFDVAFIGCFYTIGMVYRSGVLVGCVGGVCRLGCWWVWWCRWWWRLAGLYPPMQLDGWNDKGVWNAEIFF